MKTSCLNCKTAKTSLRWLLKEPEFQNSEYEVHQAGPKDSGGQNFCFRALKAEPVGEVQTLRAATARDRRNFFYRSNHVF
jgi:hypothetical protein